VLPYGIMLANIAVDFVVGQPSFLREPAHADKPLWC
jgi:hypothetical protein